MASHSIRLGVPVETCSEKMMERGRVEVRADYLVAGTVPIVHHALRRLGCKLPEHTPYPDILQPWFRRSIKKVASLRVVKDRLRNGGSSVFVKPAAGWKRFTGFVPQFEHDYRFNGASQNSPVWISEPVNFISEWRAYVVHGMVKNLEFCDHGGDATRLPDVTSIDDAVRVLVSTNQAPAGFVIDFGVLSSGETALIEMNDGFSFGAYGNLPAEVYWDLTWARWQELVKLPAEVTK